MGGTSGSDSDQSSTFNQSVWDPSGEFYQFMTGIAPQIFGQSYGQLNNQVGGVTEASQGAVAQSNPAQQQQLGGGFDYNKNLMDQYKQGLNSGPSAESQINASIMGGQGNNYADAMKNSMQTDANLAMNNMMNNVDARMSGGDMSGSSRGDIMQSQGAQNINQNLQRELTGVGYNTFDKNLDRNLGIAQRADSNQAANMRGLESLMSGQMGSQNQAQQSGLGGVGTQQQNMMNTMMPSYAGIDMLAQMAGAPSGASPLVLANGSGSGSSSSKGASVGGK